MPPASGKRDLETHSQKMEKLQKTVEKLFNIGAAVIAVLTMAGTAVVAFRGNSDTQQREATRRLVEQREMADRYAVSAERSRQQVQELQRQVEALQHALQKASLPTKGKPQYSQLNPVDRHLLDQLKAGEEQLSGRMGTLEGALANTPEKALALPMLKQQVDNLQDRTHSDLEGVRGEIVRLFTLTQWFIGLMFTIALGVFGLALSNIRRGDKAGTEK
jgi:hypothetical protein